jgi:hypothetical protein
MHLNSECHIKLNHNATIHSLNQIKLNNIALLISNTSQEMLAHGMNYVIWFRKKKFQQMQFSSN